MAIASSTAGLVVLDPHAPGSLSGTGNASVTVVNGTIAVDSNNGKAISGTGNTSFTASAIDVVGNVSGTGNTHFNGQLNTGSSVVSDPLASLPTPTWNPASDKGTINVGGNTVLNLLPGYYSGGIQASGNTVLNMAPGIYILGGVGITLTGNSVLNAGGGVLLYITGGGAVTLTGNGLITLTPPNPSINNFAGASTYSGIAIFQDRSDSKPAQLTGNGNLHVGGTVYLPDAALTLTGNALSFGGSVIADMVSLTGNANVTISATSGGAAKSWLVQ